MHCLRPPSPLSRTMRTRTLPALWRLRLWSEMIQVLNMKGDSTAAFWLTRSIASPCPTDCVISRTPSGRYGPLGDLGSPLRCLAGSPRLGALAAPGGPPLITEGGKHLFFVVRDLARGHVHDRRSEFHRITGSPWSLHRRPPRVDTRKNGASAQDCQCRSKDAQFQTDPRPRCVSTSRQPALGQPTGRVRPVWARPMRATCSRPLDTMRTPRSI